jgi:uncharacterized damage-inducible protein DinB
MLLDVIRSLYPYNAWANHRILIAVSNSPRAIPGTGRLKLSLRSRHIGPYNECGVDLALALEGIFSQRHVRSDRFSQTTVDPNTLGKPSRQRLSKYIDQLNPSQLAEVVSYVNTRNEKWAYPLWQQMIHQVNHATQHRSEVCCDPHHFGCSPGDLDYLVYQDELNSGSKEME